MSEKDEKLDLLWGVEEIGKAIGRTARQAHYLCATGQIPAQKIGGRWVVERGRLERFFAGEAA